MTDRIGVGIIGPGNIGMDLMYKIKNRSRHMELKLVTGLRDSKGIALAEREGIETSTDGIDALFKRGGIQIAFDATLASAHKAHAPLLKEAGIFAIDLTPAAVGPYVVPSVNLDQRLDADNVNLITCGGQATIPIVYAISRVLDVAYAEIVATISSASAGPGTRESIDEFTMTTARGLREVGGAQRAKALILLNPAVPPMTMNNTIYCMVDPEKYDQLAVEAAVNSMVEKVRQYVPGYRVKIPPTFDGKRILVMIEVEGAGDYLPRYSGNLDIETSAALAVGEQVARRMLEV
ncbi:MAG: acetaldehyde dehydrogenase (acetylating) [Clostridiales bacterium]|nr:acetaldehyde dehydrogenase (acetylating) [Clostridiales bacterium]